MQPDQRDAAYLLDILQAAEKVERYISGKTFCEFQKNEVLCDAVERNIEIIGEAARRLSQAFKQDHPDIPWRKIIAQRNVLAHEYDNIAIDELWKVATTRIAELIRAIKPLIPPLPPEINE
jgi:uncharacterized protein with HEPN domain